jgi:hypothetical protein
MPVLTSDMCACACVCVRERERESERDESGAVLGSVGTP